MEGLRRCLAGRDFQPLTGEKTVRHAAMPDARSKGFLRHVRRSTRRPPHTSPYLAVRFFLHLARLPGGVARPSALYFLLPAIGRRWPKPHNMKADILRMSAFPCPSISNGDFPERSCECFGGGVGSSIFFAGSDRRRPAGPCPLRRRKLRASTARQRASPRPGLSLLPTVPPAPRRGRGHPDGWPRNWRARNRRRTGRYAAA